jgi:hypothetical protein
MYIRVMWGLVGFGFIVAAVVLVVMAINNPHLVFDTIVEKLFHGRLRHTWTPIGPIR